MGLWRIHIPWGKIFLYFYTVTKAERDLLGLHARMGGLGFTDPVVTSSSEYEASIKVTNPLVRRIVEQEHQPPDVSEIQTLQLSNVFRRLRLEHYLKTKQ